MTETLSENVSKKNPGRPAVFTDDHLRDLEERDGYNHSRRNLQNWAYADRATDVLGRDDYTWLWDGEGVSKRDRRAVKNTILAELGRVEHPDDMREWAEILCESKPKTRAAVAMIRWWRLGKHGAGDTVDLANKLVDAFNRYVTDYPKTTHEQIDEAIERFSSAVEQGRAE